MTSQPIRPRDAATLIVHRRSRGGVEILMGRRHASHVFMPGYYVFPGGRVDPGDHRVRPATPLRPEVAEQLERTATPSRARALAAAAVRETFEETGLMLGQAAASGTPLPSGWEAFAKAGLAPAFDRLDYFFRAITPIGRPRRFNARFFMVEAIHLAGEMRCSDELEDVNWVPTEHVADLPASPITHMALAEFLRRLDKPDTGAVPVAMTYLRRGQRLSRAE